MEDRILHLDSVARASHEKKPAEAEDELLVDQFMAHLRKGNNLSEAVFNAEKETRDIISRGRRAESEAETDHLPAPRLETGKVRVHKPPPGPALGKPAATGPGLPEVQRAEQLPSPNEVEEALQLVSKEEDAELDSHSDIELDIKMKKDDERKKKQTPSHQE